MKSTKRQIKKVELQEAGITLVALVVTIIVLLILAGVTITLALGNNGVMNRAQYASNTWANATKDEEAAMGQFASDVDALTEGFINREEGSGKGNDEINIELSELSEYFVGKNYSIWYDNDNDCFKNLSPIQDASTSIVYLNDYEENGSYYYLVRYKSGFYNLTFVDNDYDANVQKVELIDLNFNLLKEGNLYLNSRIGCLNIVADFKPKLQIEGSDKVIEINPVNKSNIVVNGYQYSDLSCLKTSIVDELNEYNSNSATGTIWISVNGQNLTWTGDILILNAGSGVGPVTPQPEQ